MNLEGVSYRRVYYVVGVTRTSLDSPLRYEAKSPPNAGYSGAFVIQPPPPKKEGAKPGRVTLFCPFTLIANQVSPECGELHGATDEELTDERLGRLSAIIVDRWKMFCSFGQPRDYDVAAQVLQRLGVPVPTERPADDAASPPTEHGKPALPGLLKPVNKTSKRGQIAEALLTGERSVLEVMAQFGSTRAVILTHLYGLHADHGLGYKIVGDAVSVSLPEGCETPFAPAVAKDSVKKFKEKRAELSAKTGMGEKPAAAKRQAGRPCADEVKPLPEKGKRRDIAISCAAGWTPVEELAARHGCSTGSVRSHLADLHAKHGFGYEQDGNKVRLLTPQGWTP